MYRRPKFLEILHEIREQMSREADYDVDLFAESVRSGIKATRTAGRLRVAPDGNTNEPQTPAPFIDEATVGDPLH
jgi:hypothetical protein